MAKQSAPVQDQVNEDRAPDQPTQLKARAWPAVLKRTLKEYKADNLPDLAAALTYYGVLAIFPMLIVLVSVLGLDRQLRHPAADRTTSGRSRPARPSRSSRARSPTSRGTRAPRACW